MQQSVQSLSALERRIDLSVSAAVIEKEVQSRLAKLARDVKMPGFRPGKVPLKMVAATYGAQVQQDVLNDKVGEAFNSAINAEKLRVAGAPKLEPRSVEGSNDLAFSATFEVYPEIGPVDVAAAQIKRPTCAVGPAEVDRTIEIMRRQRATFEDVARAATKGDVVVIDFKGTLDGVAFEGGTGTDTSFTIGEGRMLSEFEAAVTGMRADDHKTFPLTFPADYAAKDLAGKTVQFDVDLKKVQQPVLPAMDADLARALGIADGDLDKMRAEIQSNLDREVTARLKSRVKEAAMEALLASATFEVPKALVEDEARRLSEATRRDLAGRGMPASEAPLPIELFKVRAERQVRLGLLAGEVVRTNALQPKPDQIRKLVEEMSQSYERPQDVINWYLSDRKRLAELEGVALEDNVVNWIVSNARVSEEPVAFDDLMGHSGR